MCSRVDFNMTTVCAQGQVNSPCQQVQRPVCYGAQPSCNYANQQCCVDVPRRVCQPVAQRIPTPRYVCRLSVAPPVCLYVCLFCLKCLSVYVSSVYLPARLFVCPSVCLSAWLSVICLSVYLPACLSFCLSVCLATSVCLPSCLSICLPVCPSESRGFPTPLSVSLLDCVSSLFGHQVY